ncbi:NYN domain-containing protein [Nocardioides sp.]|jgi:predicted RNA-binding protein with PIN domain|uniref:NYN domain-containing protein n=1 Tax=Nocardioides sp. TaxID=35761 RepID=UPI002B7338BC|nr:NYN domain-containing protein [Nocardioides sp.]HVX53476.1 NYN domain-containing protein [Nocardioides sp.]
MTAAEGPAPTATELPEPVRARVVALAASVLPEVPQLPASLRRVAAFAPARRAKAGAGAIATALDQGAEDEGGLRERIAVALRSQQRYAADRLPPGADPADVAAFAWLVRPEGWHRLLEESLAVVAPAPMPAVDAEMARLQRRVAQAEEELQEARERRRTDVEALKEENGLLRRRLGEARASGRQALSEAEEALAAAEKARAVAVATAEAQERELRQLRARIAQLEAEVEAERRAERRATRSEREEATARTRLLLDTVLEAASGLRRELALPPASASAVSPGEQAEAAYAIETADGGRNRTVGSLGELEGYLAMPRARLIVDGYNVSKLAWPTSALDAQRTRLLQGLAPLVARTGAETTVVFDAANAPARTIAGAPRGVRVVFSPAGVIADDVIRELVAAEPTGRVVLVVTDDQAVARDVSLAGARPVSSGLLLQQLR